MLLNKMVVPATWKFLELGFPAKHSRPFQAQSSKNFPTVPDDQDGKVERIRHQQKQT